MLETPSLRKSYFQSKQLLSVAAVVVVRQESVTAASPFVVEVAVAVVVEAAAST